MFVALLGMKPAGRNQQNGVSLGQFGMQVCWSIGFRDLHTLEVDAVRNDVHLVSRSVLDAEQMIAGVPGYRDDRVTERRAHPIETNVNMPSDSRVVIGVMPGQNP